MIYLLTENKLLGDLFYEFLGEKWDLNINQGEDGLLPEEGSIVFIDTTISNLVKKIEPLKGSELVKIAIVPDLNALQLRFLLEEGFEDILIFPPTKDKLYAKIHKWNRLKGL